MAMVNVYIFVLALNVCCVGGLFNSNRSTDDVTQILQSSVDFLSSYLAADTGYEDYIVPEDYIEETKEGNLNLAPQGDDSMLESGAVVVDEWLSNNPAIASLYAQVVYDDMANINFEQVLADFVLNPCNLTEQGSTCLFFQKTVRYTWDDTQFGCVPSRQCLFQGFATQADCEQECTGDS